MVRLTIDNRKIEVEDGITILQAADRLGIPIPHFCYHPRLSIDGGCRMCLVEVEGRKDLVISCQERASEGMVVGTDTQVVRKARADVLELLLLNHPLDCPVCDQAGECELQDYFFKYSLRPSRAAGNKVPKPKAKKVGPHVMLDAERCVACTRCIRFCEEIAGVHEIGLYERGERQTIDVAPGSKLANPYSLCTVDLCPVGALTSVDFRFRKRVWLLSSAPSICIGCATGCNVWIDHRDGLAHRMRPRENESINRSWMCDEGRMTYKAINGDDRVKGPLVLKKGEMVPVDWDQIIERVCELVGRQADGIVGVLSARSSMEENLAVARLIRELGGRLVWSGLDGDPGFADSIIRDADRNPNTAGVGLLSKERMGEEGEHKGWLILDSLNRNELLKLVSSKPAWTILLASNLPTGQRWADVILPKCTYAEQDGGFINRDQIVQPVLRAFGPLYDSQPAWELAGRLARGLGKGWEMASAAACMEWGRANFESLRHLKPGRI
jgi:NADH-quinone oxidoreductase subunit G